MPLPRFSECVLSVAFASFVLCACTPGPNNAALCSALTHGTNGTEVIVQGTVVRVIGTHNGPSGSHEGFFLHVHDGCDASVRVETNVAFTGEIPLRRGEAVVVKGEFDDDLSGGVIHFTHRELHGHHPSGYVKIGSTYYW